MHVDEARRRPRGPARRTTSASIRAADRRRSRRDAVARSTATSHIAVAAGCAGIDTRPPRSQQLRSSSFAAFATALARRPADRAPPCAPRRRWRPARESPSTARRRRREAISTPRFIGPGCMTITSGLRAREPLARHAEHAKYSRSDGMSAPPMPLELHAQHHDDVGAVDRLVDVGRRPSRPVARCRAGTSVGGPQTATSAPSFVSSQMFDRDHAAVQHVADDGDLAGPRCGRLCSRIVSASSSACVGCSCVPSPALMTPRSQIARQEVRRARRRVANHDHVGAHRLEVPRRVERASRPCSTRAPTRRCSACRRTAASRRSRTRSACACVASKNRLTIVLPRSVGTFLIGRSPISAHRLGGVENEVDLVGGQQVSMPSRSLARRCRPSRSRRPLRGSDLVAAVDLLERSPARSASSEVGTFLPT